MTSSVAWADQEQQRGCAPGRILRAWNRALATKPNDGAPYADWSAARQRQWHAVVEAANGIYVAYRSGSLNWNAERSCIADAQSQQQLESALSQAFFDRSLEELEASGLPTGRAIAAAVREQTLGGRLLSFRLTGHLPSERAPTESMAGYHRGRGSIFAEFLGIPREQWLVVFAHELVHALDTDLFEAIETYSDPELVREAVVASLAVQSFAGMTAGNLAKLDRWLMAGLDRGLLAEYRAWVVTARLYREGLRAGQWQEIGWMERLGSSRESVYAALDPGFLDPISGLIAHPVIRERLLEIRKQLRLAPPALGTLEKLLTAPAS